MDGLYCGCFLGNSVCGTISFASFVDGSACTTGHVTHAVVLLCSALLGWNSLRAFCTLARSDGAPTKSTCVSPALDRAQHLQGQLVTMSFVVDEGQQPHVTVIGCFSGSPVVCQPWHLLNAVCLLRWTAFIELIGRCATASVGDLPRMPDGSQADIPDQHCDSIGDVNGKPCETSFLPLGT